MIVKIRRILIVVAVICLAIAVFGFVLAFGRSDGGSSAKTKTDSVTFTAPVFKFTWYDYDGETVLDYQELESAADCVYQGEEPTRADSLLCSYIFDGWDFGNSTSPTEVVFIARYIENNFYEPVFADNSWQQIKSACQSGAAPLLWNLGDTKEVSLSSGYGTYHVRIVDMTVGRYEYSDQSRCSNVVFEFVELLHYGDSLSLYCHSSSGINDGGWRSSEIRSVLNDNVVSLFPDELRSIIPEVNIISSNGYDFSETSVSANKLFLPSEYEIFGRKYQSVGLIEGCPQFVYYGQHNTWNDHIRYDIDGNAAVYWLRSPSENTQVYYVCVAKVGNPGNGGAINAYGVCPCFAI